jgi:hypothetical protein
VLTHALAAALAASAAIEVAYAEVATAAAAAVAEAQAALGVGINLSTAVCLYCCTAGLECASVLVPSFLPAGLLLQCCRAADVHHGHWQCSVGTRNSKRQHNIAGSTLHTQLTAPRASQLARFFLFFPIVIACDIRDRNWHFTWHVLLGR